MFTNEHSGQHQKRDQDISQHSDSFGSTILAGSGRCPSRKSSESSFYSAESTIVTKKLPTSRCDESSIAIKDSSNSVTEFSEDIESSTTASHPSINTLDENIESKCFTSTPASIVSVRSDLDLNKAQNLFKSTNSHNRDTNYNVDNASNTSHSVCEEENLHFLVGNLSTSEYAEIPQFLQKFRSLTRNVDSETSKEVTRRLTSSFHQDPQEFANRLITIIEESDTNYELEKTAVSVNKMVSAYLKLCKYVEEESMPTMIDISHAHLETSPMAYSGPLQNIKDKHVLNETTPPNSGSIQRRFGPKISPRNHRKKATKTLSSPLYVSTLTRAAAPIQTPTPITTPGSTPGSTPRSARNHNDSSFTHWEKKCMVSPHEKRGCDKPDITDEEKLRLAEAEKQLLILQAAASPNSSPIKTQINIYNINCDIHESSSEFETSLSPKFQYNIDMSSNIQSSYDENDMMESIMFELAEKRKRCYETERTIRRIDAESSAYSISPQASEIEESEKIVGFLNALRNRTDYPKIMERDKKQSRTTPKHNNKFKGSSNHSSDIPAGAQNNQHLNVTMRKSTKTANSHSKSPTGKAPGKCLSTKEVKSQKNSKYDKLPTLSPRRVASAHLKAVAISPIDGPSVSGSSKSATASQNTKTPSTYLVRTPRAKSPKTAIHSPTSTKNRQTGKTQEASTKKPTVSKNRSNSTTKSVDRQKSQFLNADKGFTLKYLNSSSRSRSPSVSDKKMSTVIKPQCENKYCIPTVSITSATPNSRGYKKSSQSRTLGEKKGNTPTTQNKCRDGKGKFFNTPGKTPQPKIRPKPMTFFSVVDSERKPLQRSQLLTKYYNPGEVKSPVAEYVNGTDTTLLQNIRGMKNEYLLTPKKQNKGRDELKFKLAAKKNAAEKSKKKTIFDCEVESISDVNDENVYFNGCNLPKVSYQMPSAVHEIHADHQSPRGARAKRLMEAKESRVVIQHAGRAIPHIRTVEHLDMSIHVAKSAEKQKFVLRSKDDSRKKI